MPRCTAILGIAIMTFAGCGRGPGNGGLPPGCEEAPLSLALSPLGVTSQQAFPETSLTLKVLALKTAGECIGSADDVVAATGDVVTWNLLGNPPDAWLGQNAVTVDNEGVAQVTINTGTAQGTTIQVRAEATGATPVTFSIRVKVDAKRLESVGTSPLDSAVNRTERIRVRLVRPSTGGGPGAPVRGMDIPVTFIDGARNQAGLDSGTPSAGVVTTDAAGIATVRFQTGSLSGLTYRLEFCGKNSCPGVPTLGVTINVAERAAQAGECVFFTDCNAGLVCDQGICKNPDIYCDVAGDCPVGYLCSGTTRSCVIDDGGVSCENSGECGPGQICGGGNTCISNQGCVTNLDCVAGWTCDLASGACIPPPDEDALDVRGEWLTRYHFDISDTLPGFFTNGLLPVVSFLDLAFRSQLEIGIPIVGDILEALIDQLIAEYVPRWLITVTRVLGDFLILFQNIEVEGDMVLAQSPESPVLGTQVSGDEVWSSVRVFIPDLCAGGIQEYQTNPDCAAVDIVLNPVFSVSYSNNSPTVGVRVDPFLGQVQGDQLRLFNRNAELELRQLINVVLDVVVAAASDGAYWDFEQFLTDIVPCYDLQLAIDDLACSVTDGSVCVIPGLEALCDAAALAAASALTTQLGNIPVGLDLEFDARAKIRDTSGNGIAELLGSPIDSANTQESAIVGDTDALYIFGGELDESSWWYGGR